MKIKLLILFILSFFMFLPSFSEESVILPSEKGRVMSVQYVDTDDAVVQTKQVAEIKILTGEFKGQTVELENVLTGNPYYDIKLKKGIKVLLHAEENEAGGVEYSVEDICRA